MIFKLSINIPSFVSQCKCIDAAGFMFAVCKYFICPLLIFYPYFSEATFPESVNVRGKNAASVFVGGEDLPKLGSRKTVKKAKRERRVKNFPKLSGGLCLTGFTVISPSEIGTSASKNKKTCKSFDSQLVIIVAGFVLAVLIPIYNSCRHNEKGELRPRFGQK